ncbi:AAA family ATPase [Clostridium sardiniense]|uniref:endopeptidase La n=1 Tax=Clostridium sardiniense TaxID=29369 RepID=A0ABS7KZA1_CLOSR|nr:AAA family ATPase [Clostridium sardiniense]MBY0756143.1 AAA family ATPase [Clostridium sardiniense]MDQ0458914.1 putative ATP-dependent protease [Clostridium sardiniense]
MKKELTQSEIIYDVEYISEDEEINFKEIPEISTPYKEIKRAINIKRAGYNLYMIDSFSNDKIDGLVNFIDNEYKSLEPPSDICYATLKDRKKPFPIFISNGRGKELKKEIKELKEEYTISFLEFFNTSSDEEKDDIVENIHLKRNKYISELVEVAKVDGFDVKATSGGFAFIPLSEGEVMTEKEYDELDIEDREEILQKATKLKQRAEVILDDLKELEVGSIERLKVIFKNFIDERMENIRDDLLLEFIRDDDVYNYLENLYKSIEEELIENYSIDLEDEDTKVEEILGKYNIEVLVDNSNNDHPRVIYEDDPNIVNLLGNIEYESQNGNYVTDLSFITPGSLLEANEGCVIIRLNRLIQNPNSYYYLKKTLMSEKLNLDSNRNYLELLSINGLKPEPVPINVKVIIIGDYESYNILCSNDYDFKNLFPLKCEIKSEIKNPKNIINGLKKFIVERAEKNKLLKIEEAGINSIIRFLVREASSRERINVDESKIDNILVKADNLAKEDNEDIIGKKYIENIIYEKDSILDDYMDMYKEKKIFIKTEGKVVGNINGLAVLDTGIYRFGKPLRITCLVLKGDGSVIDIHKESKLSGKIHEKSIQTLTGLLYSILSPYEKLPINLHLSFEQSYGMIEGDSASVAEMIAMLSSISKRGVKQNIAVTGSLNQFGEVQAIGGVNEKIEGFFNVCKEMGGYKGKGVLIPSTNKDELILCPEVEAAIREGDFHIYEMDVLDDAIETLILEDNEKLEDFYKSINEEIKKYKE